MLAFGFASGFAISALLFFQPASAAQKKVVRVLVLKGKNLRIRADGDSSLYIRGLRSGNRRIRALKVREQNKKLKLNLNIYGRWGGWAPIQRTSQLRIRSNDPRGIWLGKRRYRGELRLDVVGEEIQVINYLDLEKYLASVVGSEMPKSWPMAALQAQAVAARTYVLQKLGTFRPYDIQSNQANQVYLGIESETKSTKKAVRKTRSLVLTHKGRLINAVFHSSSGGLTESSGAVWKNQLPYLVGVPDHDQHSPRHQWDIRFTKRELLKAFRETGGLEKIKLITTSPSGRVLKAKVYGPRGVIEISGKELRKRMNLKSTLVRFKMVSSDTLAKHDLAPAFSSASLLNLRGSSPSDDMRKSRGFWRDWSRGGESILDPRIPMLSSPPSLPLRPMSQGSTVLDLPPPPPPPSSNFQNSVLIARGFGAGHGVGMSQWGAHGLAERGASFRQILNHYYTGVAIRSYQGL